MGVTIDALAVEFAATGEDQVITASARVERAIERLSVRTALAMSAMAAGSSMGIEGLVHSLATLGFAFGTWEGILTTTLASAGLQLYEFWKRQKEEAKKAAEEIKKRTEELAKAFDDLAIKAASLQFGGKGLELAQELKRVWTELNVGAAGRGGIEWANEKMKEFLELSRRILTAPEIKPASRGIVPIEIKAKTPEREAKDAKEDRDKLERQIKEADDRDLQQAAQHHAEIRNLEKLDFQVRQAAFGENLAAQLKDLDAYMADVAERYGTDTEEYKQAQLDKLRIQREINDRLKAQNEKASAETMAEARRLAGGIAHAMDDVFSAHSFNGMMDKLGDAILAALGEIFVRLGESMIAASGLIQAAASALLSLSGAGSLAAGIALVAFGSALGAASQRSSSAGGGSSYATPYSFQFGRSETGYWYPQQPSAVPSSRVSAPTPVNFHATIIGKDDPKVQREILELVERGTRRGSVGIG